MEGTRWGRAKATIISGTWVLYALLLMLGAVYGTGTLSAQSVSITNLGSIVATPVFTPVVSITNGAGNVITQVCLLFDGRPVTPEPCGTVSTNWAVPILVGLPGDGPATFQAIAKDYAGNILASSSVYSQAVRINGTTNSVGSVPTSGAGAVTPVSWNGHNWGSSCPGTVRFDGREPIGADDIWSGGSCSGGQGHGTFASYRLPDGPHEAWFTYSGDGTCLFFGGTAPCDPYVVGNTFVAGNVSGSAITLTSPQQHWLVQNRPVAFTSSGTLPTDFGTTLPLLTGKLFGWGVSPTSPNTIVSGNATSGVISITLSSAPLVVMGGNISIYRFTTSNNASFTGICDGSYTVASVVSNTITVNAPSCPDGTWPGATGTAETEIITNAYYANFTGSLTSATFSYTPGGATITFSSGGSGTHTVSYRMRPGYWATIPFLDVVDTTSGVPYPFAYAYATFTSSNGSASMQVEPDFDYVHLCLTPTATCPSSIANPGKIRRTDKSTVAVTTGATYSYTDDGGFTGVASVNASGTISALSPGWGQVQMACATCDSGNPLPNPRPTYIQVENNATFPHFSKTNGIISTYNPSQSFIPVDWWHLDAAGATPYIADASQRSAYGPLMNDSAITASFVVSTALAPGNADPLSVSCNPAVNTTDLQLQTFAQAYNIFLNYDFEQYSFTSKNIGAVANGTGYNRLACLTTSATNLAALGVVSSLYSADEVSAKIGNNIASPTAAIGTTNFPGPIVVSGGTATVTTLIDLQANWSQASGQGGSIFYSGATNTCLNGWHLPAGRTTNASGLTISYTFTTTCGNGTYNASTDAGLQQRYIWTLGYVGDIGTIACVLPKFAGIGDATYQSWTQGFDENGTAYFSDISLSSMVSNGTTLTVNYTGHKIVNGQSFRIMNATNIALNTVAIVSGVATNSFTIPTTVAAGTYNSGTDPNLIVSVDCDLPNNYFAQLHSAVQAGANLPILNRMLGANYNSNTSVKTWNAPSVADAMIIYHSDQCVASYGDDCSVWSTIWSNPGGISRTALLSRAFQSPARRDMIGTIGLSFEMLHKGNTLDPVRDRPNLLAWRPETVTARIEFDKQIGISSYEMNWYLTSGLYTAVPGTVVGGQAINQDYPTNHVWKAYAVGFREYHNGAKYWLQTRGNAPSYGPMFSTGVAVGPNGNSLSITCLADAPTPISGTTVTPSAYAQTFDLTPVRIAGGTMYKSILTGYTLKYVAMPTNPTSESIDPCGSPGQTTTYYAQPPGAASDLDLVTFSAPAVLPFGATKTAIRVGYYPRLMDSDPVTDCTTGCQIPINHSNSDAWYQILYTDAHGVILSQGEAQKYPRIQ